MTRLWIALLLSGCVASDSAPCGDGRVCPEGTTCAQVAERPMCLTSDQLASCVGVDPFGACGEGMRCYDGACLRGGCGNAILDPEEECDDGNLTAGDTCSASCLTERCGNGSIDLVLGEECDDGAAGVSGDGCSSTCKSEVLGWHDISPSPITARQGVAMAYDAARGVVIAFGGLGPTATTDDTWMWDRTKWTRLHPAVAPGPRYGHAMAYDPVRERVVLFGGRDAANKEIAETWEWDGVTWSQKLAASSPMAQADVQMAFHPGRNTLVLISRYDTSTYEWNGTTWSTIGSKPPLHSTVPLGYDVGNNQLVTCGNKNTSNCVTYTFNGTGWTEVATATTKPATTSGMRMAYDSVRSKLVLYGGTVDDIWEWSGTNWVVAAPASKPPARSAPGLAFDGAQLVMFSGSAAGNVAVSDTWTWSGTAWAPRTPPVHPAGRYDAAYAHDRRHNRAVVFGGTSQTGGFTDTWEWTGTDWRQLTSLGTPPAGTRSVAMTYDLARRRYVLFGGVTASSVELDETWELDGTAWQKIAVSGDTPAARTSAALIYDEARGVTLLFGGRDAAFVAIADTWTYDGAAWTRDTPATSPSERSDAAIGYDPTRGRVVLFGGGGFPPNDETWEWDGTNWTQAAPATRPPARIWAQLAYDALLGGMVLVGGRTGFAGEILADVWLWDGVTWTELTAQGTPAPRFGAVTFFDQHQRALVTFGGRHNTVESTSTWALRYAALAAPEACGTSDEDIDNDGLAGCDDPDCWGRCKPLCPPESSCTADEHCGDALCSSVEDYLICPADCSP